MHKTILVAMLFAMVVAVDCQGQTATRTPLAPFINLNSDNPAKRLEAIDAIRRNWNDGDSGMLIESARFTRNPGTRRAILAVLSQLTGQSFGNDFDQWYRWLWNVDVQPNPNYASFKQRIYARIDPRFAEYFSDDYATEIRLDEIRWGGVLRDGIPPLKNPETIAASEADYLADSDVVFGVEFGGQSRAYPKRILAWHEMVKDVVGGRSINGVYCTLCGSMIVYDTQFDGRHYELGTSGFLYRSNKLMYDHETKSMWSTLRGSPVVGPLVGKNIELEPLYVVTTTWGAWKSQHPDTDVLSLRTGYRRDYGEGVAYKSYFATDELMFTVPKIDTRLKNKDEVLVVRIGDEEPKVIAADFLRRNRIYHDKIGTNRFVVLTDESGANRVYNSGDLTFEEFDDQTSTTIAEVLTADQSRWKVTEDALYQESQSVDFQSADSLSRSAGKSLARIPAHRAFWFGWNAAFPGTEVIK